MLRIDLLFELPEQRGIVDQCEVRLKYSRARLRDLAVGRRQTFQLPPGKFNRLAQARYLAGDLFWFYFDLVKLKSVSVDPDHLPDRYAAGYGTGLQSGFRSRSG